MEKKRKKKGKKKVPKEEISEVFIVKNGKEKIIKTHTEIEKKEEQPSKKQLKKENKILRDIIIIMAGLVLMFLVGYAVMYYSKHFEVDGVKFETMRVGQLTLYKTFLPVIYNGAETKYNFYLRTDPRILENIQSDGSISIKKNMVLNMTNSFNCNGDGVIAIANLQNLYKVLGTDIMKDENATCDSLGRYMFVQIGEGDETKISEFGPRGGCYNIYINNCEILEGTEKFLLDTLIEVNKKL